MADNKKLDRLLAQLEKKYTANKAKEFKTEKKLKTGLFGLDSVLDGGISQNLGGHIIEFFGAESSCKSTFSLKVIASYQKQEKVCVFIDGENSYDAQWAEICGVDNNKLIVIRPQSLEEMGDILVQLLQNDTDLIVIDSIVSFIPENEIDRDTNQPTMALAARINSIICRKINKNIANKNITMLFINQMREKVGVMYGSPLTTGGGRALKHLYHTRIEMRKGKPIDIGSGEKKERIGYEIHLKGVKNKKGIPYKSAVVDFYFNGSIDDKKSIFFAAIKYNVINLSGKTYSFGDKKFVGKDKALQELTEKDFKEIEKEIFKASK